MPPVKSSKKLNESRIFPGARSGRGDGTGRGGAERLQASLATGESLCKG